MMDDFQQDIERYELKSNIKNTAGKAAKMLFILGVMTQILSIGTVFIIKFLESGFIGNLTSGLTISKDMYNYLAGYLPCIIADIIVIIIGIKITKIKIKSDMFCKNESKLKFISLGAISCIGVGIVSGVIYTLYSTLLSIMGISIPAPDFSMPTGNPFMLALFLGYVCILGPILEEIIFRGFILKSMQRFENLTAIIVTSILFSMFHLNLVQFVPPILIGLVLGFITVKSKSLIPSIIAHIFNNTVAFGMSAIVTLDSSIQTIFLLLYSAGSLLGLIFFIIEYSGEFKTLMKEETRIYPTYKKVLLSFSGKWSIVYIIFYAVMIIGMFILTNLSGL